MPGFTAQDSLYTSGARYQHTAQRSSSTGGQAVIPQQISSPISPEMTCFNCKCAGNSCECETCIFEN